MVESGKKKGERAKVAAVPDLSSGQDERAEPTEGSVHTPAGCPVALCPICTAITLIQPLSPDVVEHLLNAGREFLLAAKAALDAVAGGEAREDDTTLEKIDIG